MLSARALRDVRQLWGDDEAWPVELTAFAQKPKKLPNPFVRTAAIPFAFLVLILVWLAPTVAVQTPVRNYLPSGDKLQGVVERTFPSLRVQKFRDDFRVGLGDWMGAASHASDWVYQAGAVRPGGLRLWKRSMEMSDYQFEFQTEIEQKAVGWAFRAKDLNNYYATKLAVAKPDNPASARILRYVVLNGVPQDRVQLPSPLPLRQQEAYRIRMSVKGNRFSTLVNDQLVDQWSDDRLRAGGIGFFTDQGETASIRWVSIADRDTMAGRLFASSLLITPAGGRAFRSPE